MQENENRVKVFIGSSAEGKEYAEMMQSQLEYDVLPTVWTQDIFHAGQSVFDSLFTVLDDFQIAVFIFTPDDKITIRDNEYDAVRDNLIYELGLFSGRLGKGRTFFVYPRSHAIRIPSDLLGVTNISFDDMREDRNIKAMLNSAVVEIKQIAKDINKITNLTKRQKVLSVNSGECKISIPVFNAELLTGTHKVTLLSESKLQQQIIEFCGEVGVQGKPYHGEVNTSGDEIHIGGPSTNVYVNNYLPRFFPTVCWRCTAERFERYAERVSEKLNPNLFKIVVDGEAEGFTYGTAEDEILENNDDQEYAVLIKISNKDIAVGKKNIHMLFGTGAVGTKAAVKYFLECYESLYDLYEDNHYFIAFPVDRRSGIVKGNQLVDLTDKMF